MQSTSRNVKCGETSTRYKAHLLLSALAGPLQEFASLIIAAESHQRLCSANGCAPCEVEIAASSRTPEALKRSLRVTSVERIGARINQATGVFVVDRPTCAQKFIDVHPMSVCDRLGLRRPALIRCEKSSDVCVKLRALRAWARHEEWRCYLTQWHGSARGATRGWCHHSVLQISIADNDQVRAAIGGLLSHPLNERDVCGINQEHRREAREVAKAKLCVAAIKFNPARGSANGSSKRGVAQQCDVPNAIAGERQGELLPNLIRANSADQLHPLAATDERASNAHAETTCLMSPVSGNLTNRTADDGDHL